MRGTTPTGRLDHWMAESRLSGRSRALSCGAPSMDLSFATAVATDAASPPGFWVSPQTLPAPCALEAGPAANASVSVTRRGRAKEFRMKALRREGAGDDGSDAARRKGLFD